MSSEGKCALIGATCPRTDDPREKRYCPFWSDDPLIWENTRTGESRSYHCAAMMMMQTQKEVIAASNRPAAAVESVRNEIVQGFSQVAGVMTQLVREGGAPRVETGDADDRIERDTDDTGEA